MHKKIILWISAIVVTFLVVFVHQRLSPYYPISGRIEIAGERVTYMFRKIHYGKEPMDILIRTDVSNLEGQLQWRRKDDPEWKDVPLTEEGNFLSAEIIPPPAGTNIEYKVLISHNDLTYQIPPGNVVPAFISGSRPASVMYVFYFFLYGGLLIAVRGALEYFNPEDKKILFSLIPAVFFFITSIVFYPFIKSFEMDAINRYVPPFHSLFDTPLIIIFLLWFVTTIIIFKFNNKMVLLISGILTIIVYQFSGFY
jgi:hypothetical protein